MPRRILSFTTFQARLLAQQGGIEIGVTRTQCLDRRIAERAELESEIALWKRRRNASADEDPVAVQLRKGTPETSSCLRETHTGISRDRARR